MRSIDRGVVFIKEQGAFLLLSPACVASYQPYYLDVARYAHGNKTANLLNNQTKSGKESIDRFGIKERKTLQIVFSDALRFFSD